MANDTFTLTIHDKPYLWLACRPLEYTGELVAYEANVDILSACCRRSDPTGLLRTFLRAGLRTWHAKIVSVN